MSEPETPLRVQVIYGNPKPGGFVHGCLDRVADHLEGQGMTVGRLRLVEANIRDCTGCFTCLREGACVIDDDLPQIIDAIRAADGLVVGASVRNGFFPALYKRLYERITYILGFGRDLHGKHVLGIGAVGIAGGRKPLGKMVTLREFHTVVAGYLFFHTGIPTRLEVDDVAPKLDRAADRLSHAMATRARLPWLTRASSWVDDLIVRKFMLEHNSDGAFDYVIDQWRKRGLM